MLRFALKSFANFILLFKDSFDREEFIQIFG